MRDKLPALADRLPMSRDEEKGAGMDDRRSRVPLRLH